MAKLTTIEKSDRPNHASAQIFTWISLVLRLILSGMWIYAGAIKIGNLEANLVSVEAYRLPIPTALERLIGYSQPALEIAVGVLLLIGLFTRLSAAVSAIAMLIFIGGITWAWAKGLNIDCGCFSAGGVLPENVEPQYLTDILRDLGFLILAVWLVWRPGTLLALDTWLFQIPKELISDHSSPASGRSLVSPVLDATLNRKSSQPTSELD